MCGEVYPFTRNAHDTDERLSIALRIGGLDHGFGVAQNTGNAFGCADDVPDHCAIARQCQVKRFLSLRDLDRRHKRDPILTSDPGV